VASRDEPGYCELKLGTVTIGLGPARSLPPNHPIRPGSTNERNGLGVEIVTEADDVDAAYQRADESDGYPVEIALGSRPWGLRDFRVVSPGGYYFRVTSRA
jgi:hypothetical protein